jgi:hypothetical protein
MFNMGLIEILILGTIFLVGLSGLGFLLFFLTRPNSPRRED